MYISDILNKFENSLRLFINSILESSYGKNYINLLIFKKYKRKWENYKLIDDKERLGGFKESRLIFYSDIRDLKNIISSNWNLFMPWLKIEEELSSGLTK